MKRFASAIMVCVILASCCFLNVFADSYQEDSQVVWFDDGSYLVVTISESASRASGTKSGNKTCSHYNSSGELQWIAVLTGTFTYDGTTSTCTSSKLSIDIVNDAWYIASQTSGRSGNDCYAEVTMGRKLLGVTVSEKAVELNLSCDVNGNLS